MKGMQSLLVTKVVLDPPAKTTSNWDQRALGGMMERLEFSVKGSQPDPYQVSFEADGENVRAFCTCAAGENGGSCKHRLDLMDGVETALLSSNTADVVRLKELLKGSSLEAAYKDVQKAAADSDVAKQKLASAKKALSKVMHG